MKLFTKISWLLMAVCLLVLPACGSNTAAPTVDTGPIFTQVASTALALQTQVAQQQAVPTATSIPLASPTPQSIPTLEATNTPLITDTLQPTSTPTSAPVVVNTLPSNGSPAPIGPVPTMDVTLIGNGIATFEESVPVGKQFIFRAQVENTSNIPLQVVANLAVPAGWGVIQNPFSDCPATAELAHKQTCTISWYFKPLGTGQVYLRVYVRAYYVDSNGNTQRITQSPAFIVNLAN